MAYSVQADLEKAAGGPNKLIELTDNDADGAVDSAVLTDAIADADSLIDAHVQKRHSTPIAAPIPAFVVKLSAELAVYELKKQRGALTEQNILEQEQRLELLTNLSNGKITVGVDPLPGKSTSVKAEVIDRAATEDISRESMKGFA